MEAIWKHLNWLRERVYNYKWRKIDPLSLSVATLLVPPLVAVRVTQNFRARRVWGVSPLRLLRQFFLYSKLHTEISFYMFLTHFPPLLYLPQPRGFFVDLLSLSVLSLFRRTLFQNRKFWMFGRNFKLNLFGCGTLLCRWKQTVLDYLAENSSRVENSHSKIIYFRGSIWCKLQLFWLSKDSHLYPTLIVKHSQNYFFRVPQPSANWVLGFLEFFEFFHRRGCWFGCEILNAGQ